MSPSLRAMKPDQIQFSLRSSGQYRSDQGPLREEISEKAARRGAGSPSMAMAEVYEKSDVTAQIEAHASVGLGKDIRFESKKLTGFSLSFEDKIHHLSIFARTHEHDHGKQPSRMARFSQRMRDTV